MNILVITQSAEIVGGANRSLLSVIEYLKNKYGHNIFCLVPGKGEFISELEKKDIDYKIVPYLQTAFFKKGDLFDVYRIFKVIRKCIYNKSIARNIYSYIPNKCQFDCVYINDTTNTFGYLVSKKLNIPFVWHFRSYDSRIRKYMLFESELRNHPNGKYVVISNAMKEYMIKKRGFSEETIRLVFNGIERQEETDYRQWSSKLTDTIHCLECGAISEAKGQMDAVKAFAELKKRGYTNYKLHIAGSEQPSIGLSYADKLKEIIQENHIEDMVVFEGEVKNMGKLRKNMNIELVCSVCEAFGRVTIEGMQAGLAVIGSNTGGTLDIIEDGVTGYLYEQGNYISLAKKIIQVSNAIHDTNRVVTKARKKVDECFLLDQNVYLIDQVLKETIRYE